MRVSPTEVNKCRTSAIRVSAWFVVAILFFVSCGKEKTEPPQTTPAIDPYQSWSKYSYGHFVVRVSPLSSYSKRLMELAKAFDRFLLEISNILEMPVPDGTIYLYVYSSPMEGKRITGRETPFSDDSTIHWDISYAYGYQLTKFLLAKKGVQPGKFNVINEGLPHLLNFSGINYHAKTIRLVDSGGFIPVTALGNNAVFDTLQFGVKQCESASLCGFVMFNFGVERLLALARSNEGWQESIVTLMQLKPDVFEKSWLDFARTHAADSTAVIEEVVDSTKKE